MCNKLCNKLSNKTPSYLTVRNGIYYFCYRIPHSVSEGKTVIFRKSLKTTSFIDARKRIVPFLDMVGECKIGLFNGNNNTLFMNSVETERHLKNINSCLDAKASVDDEFLYLISDGETLPIPRCFDPRDESIEQEMKTILAVLGKAKYSHLKDESRVALSRFSELIQNGTEEQRLVLLKAAQLLQQEIKKRAFSQFNVDAAGFKSLFHLLYAGLTDEDEEFIERSVVELLETNTQLLDVVITCLEFDLESIRHTISHFNTSLKLNENVLSEFKESIECESEVEYLLSDATKEFLEWKDGGRVRTQKVQNDCSDALNFLCAVIGDLPVTQINQTHIEAAINKRRTMPRRNQKPETIL